MPGEKLQRRVWNRQTKLTYNHWLVALVKEKCSSTKPTRLATRVMCHPDTEQNRPYKIHKITFIYFCFILSIDETSIFAKINCTLTGHNWQNWKRAFLSCYCYEIYSVQALGLKTFQLYLKIYNLGQFLEKKINIFPITA